MAENLNIKIGGSACYDNDPANCAKYGRLYTWEQVKKIADQISSWHLPSHEEWDELCEALGGTPDNDGDYPNLTAKFIKILKMLLAGRCTSDGNFSDLGYYGYFWSSSSNGSSNAWSRYVDASSGDVYRSSTIRTYLFSVRLVKDD